MELPTKPGIHKQQITNNANRQHNLEQSKTKHNKYAEQVGTVLAAQKKLMRIKEKQKTE